jgi:hypothetical protein
LTLAPPSLHDEESISNPPGILLMLDKFGIIVNSGLIVFKIKYDPKRINIPIKISLKDLDAKATTLTLPLLVMYLKPTSISLKKANKTANQ